MQAGTLDASGYQSDKGEVYLRRYETFFRPLQQRDIRLLELGVYKGGSLLLWRDYFERGLISGLDVSEVKVDDPSGRIRIYKGLQQDCLLLDRIRSEVAPEGFDIIIDDASHIADYSIISFWHLFLNHLKPGGIYVIEDWGTGYWDTWPDGRRFELRRKVPSSRIDRLMRKLGGRKNDPVQTHCYGMVGFIKQLVDECGIQDITYPGLGCGQPRSSVIELMQISRGLAFIIKKYPDQDQSSGATIQSANA